MARFIKSPLWDNWFISGDVNKSLIVCSPYFKKNALDKIIEKFELNDDECILNIRILIRGKQEDFINGSSDLTALDALLGLRCINIDKVRRTTNLHMKAYLKDGEDLLIGSGNCTKAGLSFGSGLGNVEGAIQTDEMEVINDFSKYFDEIFDNAEPLSGFYDEIVKGCEEDVIKPIAKSHPLDIISKSERKAKFDYRNKERLTILNNDTSELSAADIPQYSNFQIVINETLEAINNANEKGEYLTFETLGEMLPGQNVNTSIAKKKYGENHAKTAEILGLVTIIPNKPRLLQMAPIGKMFLNATDDEKRIILAKQLSKTMIVRDISEKYYTNGPFKIDDYLKMYLKESTANRRRANVRVFFEQLKSLGVEGAELILKDVFNK